MDAVLGFWFDELTPSDWFSKNERVDSEIRTRFGALHTQAAANELADWRASARGSLAEIIVLDQFSRNLFRDSPLAFACDAQALALAQVAIAKGFDGELDATQRRFIYMPFMHSESKKIHETAVGLFTALGDPTSLDFEYQHQAIIDRFGRYPYRNKVLGRESTPDERAYLALHPEGF